jgi:hypothetical protein
MSTILNSRRPLQAFQIGRASALRATGDVIEQLQEQLAAERTRVATLQRELLQGPPSSSPDAPWLTPFQPCPARPQCCAEAPPSLGTQPMTDDEMYAQMKTREFAQGDGDLFGLTEHFLQDPVLRRRLVRTQIEELWTLYWHYPMEELSAVRRVLELLRKEHRHVEPFDHPMLAELESYDEEE